MNPLFSTPIHQTILYTDCGCHEFTHYLENYP